MSDLMRASAVDLVPVNNSTLTPAAEDEVLKIAQDNGMAILTNRPLLNGRYFSPVRGQAQAGWAADFECAGGAQFAVNCIPGHPAANGVLAERPRPGHAQDNIRSGIGRLPDDKTRQGMQRPILDLA